MENTNLKIECHKLNDDGSMVYQPMTNLDGLVWNGVYIIRAFNDNGSWGLPFTLADNEAVNLVVKDQAQKREDATDTQRVVVQTVTRVEKETGEVLTYSRIRRNVNGTQVWSEWSYLTAESTSDIKPNSVTTEKLAAEVREKINNPLRPLFIAAGAEYNDTGTDKTKTAPWGETVTHKAGHYYLNGLGDITEEQMNLIFIQTFPLYCATDFTKAFRTQIATDISVRTNIRNRNQFTGIGGSGVLSLESACYSNTVMEVLAINHTKTGVKIVVTGMENSFYSASSLRSIIGVLSVEKCSTIEFKDCRALLAFTLHNLKSNIKIGQSAIVSKESVLCLIENASPATVITITLHPDAYARLADDADIVAALEAQPLVSLVSA